MARQERERNRLSGYDYSTERLYFVTSCVQDKAAAFETITDGMLHLNRFGLLAEQQCYWLQERYPYVVLHEFIVMPNHIHGIIQLNATTETAGKNKTISGIMGACKTTTSKLIRQTGLPEFAWQRSFHDHIIRSSARYKLIADYILNNPNRWPEDRFCINRQPIQNNI